MGSHIELNDTLQITNEQGFPAEILNLEQHQNNPISLDLVKDKIFEFHDKPNARVFHSSPTRCFLVQNIAGKWLYWGHVLVLEQTITSDGTNHTTSGKYKIIKIYDPEYQKFMTKNETPLGLDYFA